MKITIADIQRVAGIKWDVDINDADAELWLSEVDALVSSARKEWNNGKRWAKRYYNETGIADHLEDYEDGFNASEVIGIFLRSKLGKPAYFDDDDKFIAAEYVQKYGKVYTQPVKSHLTGCGGKDL